MREMKDSGIPWIGEIPKEWQVNMLSSLFDEHKQKNKDLAETNLLSLSYGKIVRKDINNKEGLLPESFDGYNIISRGDIVFRLTDLQNDKRSLRTGLCLEKGIITSAYVTIRERKSLNSSYFHYLLHSYDLCKVFYGMGDGVRQGMNYSDLRKLLVLHPTLAEQQRIAEFLDRKCAEVDEMIGLQEQIIEELKAYKQSVITEAVTKGLNPDAPMRDSGIEWIGEIPEHWGVCRVKDILEAGKDGIKIGPFGSSLTNKVNGDGECKIYGQWNIVNKDFTAGKNFVSAETYKELDAYKIVTGDILVSMMGTIGKCAIIPNGLQDGIMDSHVIKIRINKSTINPEYFELMYDKDNSTFIFEQLSRMKKGSIMDGLNSSIVKRLNLLLPPIDEQQEIVSYLLEKRSKIESLISIKLSKIDSLKEYKKSIIYEYVTGKREVE